MNLNLIHLYRVTSIWWLRIVLWLVLFIFGVLPGFLITTPILITLYILFILFLSSIIIESIRAGGSIITFGFYVNKKTIYDSAILILITISAFSLYFAINFILGAEVIGFEKINCNYFINISMLIFIYAASEELIFRGIIFQALIEKFNPIIVSIFISFIFSISHYFNPNFSIIAFFNIFLGGMLLSILYLQTFSLIHPIIFHFLWNWLQAVLLSSPISGNDYNIGILIYKRNENWISQLLLGNQFGIEEGLISAVVIIMITFIVVKYFEPNPYIASKIFFRKYNEAIITWNKHNLKL